MKYLSNILLLFACLSSYSQKYIEAQLVKQNKDTLVAFINADFEKETGNTFSYVKKIDEDSPINGSLEEFSEIYLVDSQIRYQAIEFDKQSVYARVLVKAFASLYRLKSESDSVKYVMEIKDEFHALKQMRIKKDGIYKLIKNYLKVLNYFFSDCNDLSRHEISKTKYEDVPLEELFLKYNRCVAPDKIVYSAGSKNKKESEFLSSNYQMKIGINGSFPGGKLGDSYSFGAGLDLYYLRGKPFSKFKYGITTGLINYWGKSNSLTLPGYSGGHTLNISHDNLQFIPLALEFKIVPEDFFSLGVDIGTAFAVNDSFSADLYYRGFITAYLSQKVELMLAYKNIELKEDKLETIDLGILITF
jgi:hypothetical protein